MSAGLKMEDYKTITIKAYDNYAEECQTRSKSYLQKHILKDANLFLRELSGKRILDIGSGPGRDSEYFKKQNFNPICIDSSKKMIKLCKEKTLTSLIMDFENLSFKKNSFHGIWAYTSLQCLPKIKLPLILRDIKNILTEKGIFYIGMKQGDFEGMNIWKEYLAQRFESLYSNKELIKILSKEFKILHESKVKLENTYLNFLCRAK